MAKMLTNQHVQEIMNGNNLEENKSKSNNRNSPSYKNSKKEKLNGYYGKFKFTKNGKSNPDFKNSSQMLRTAQRGEIKNQRLIQSGRAQTKKYKYNEDIDDQSYLTKFLEISTKKRMLKRESTERNSKTNKTMLRSRSTLQKKYC